MSKSLEILKSLEGIRVMIVGDAMIDRYFRGDVHRISPEAPVPVVLHRSTEDRLGGAANVALNVKALGGEAFLCSVAGDDADGELLLNKIMPEAGLTVGGMVREPGRKTTVKTRILAQHQQMLRIDSEDVGPISAGTRASLFQKITEILDNNPIDVLIFQDYNKGMFDAELIGSIIAETKKRGVLTAVDPKKANFFDFTGVDLFKPNLKEIRDSAPFPVNAEPEESLKAASDFLKEKLKNRVTMITLSEKGLFLDDGKTARRYPTIERNVADVSGAGDTVISIAAMGLAAGFSADLIAALSNLAGGQVCEFPGVVSVNRTLLGRELEQWLHQIQ